MSLFLAPNKATTITDCWMGKELHTVPKYISPKVNVKGQSEFELANDDVTVQHVSHYAMGTYLPLCMSRMRHKLIFEWIFSSPRLVAIQRLKSSVCSTIYSLLVIE